VWHWGGAHQLLALASSAHIPSPAPCWREEAVLLSLSTGALYRRER